MVNINFSLENFQGVEQGSTIVLRWPDKDDPNTIVLIFEKPAKLKVTNLKFSNEQPIMNNDAVTASVTIFNEGQLKSESYIVSWTPDLENEPDNKITSSIQNSIFPGTSHTFDLPAHVFKYSGEIKGQIYIGNGDDTFNYSINVLSDIKSVTQCNIDGVKVHQPWTTYPYLGLEGLRFPECMIVPGSQVIIKRAGGCVNTYDKEEKAWNFRDFWAKVRTFRFVDPVDENGELMNFYYGQIAIPGTVEESEHKRIAEYINKPIIVSENSAFPILEIGYMDDDYSLNSYYLGTGLLDQCIDSEPAYIHLEITIYR